MNIINIVPRAQETQDPLTDSETAVLAKYGVRLPDISNPCYLGDDEMQGYEDYETTDGLRLRLTPFESVTIRGECCVPVELVEEWSQEAIESAIASTRFYVDEFVYRKGVTVF